MGNSCDVSHMNMAFFMNNFDSGTQKFSSVYSLCLEQNISAVINPEFSYILGLMYPLNQQTK